MSLYDIKRMTNDEFENYKREVKSTVIKQNEEYYCHHCVFPERHKQNRIMMLRLQFRLYELEREKYRNEFLEELASLSNNNNKV
jgi:hypothetical protein